MPLPAIRRVRAALAVGALAALLVPAAAYPCGSRMLFERRHRAPDTEVLRVAQADLKSGRNLAALAGARKLLAREPQGSSSELSHLFGPEDGRPAPSAANLKWARRVAGVALVRLGRHDEALMVLEKSAREFKGEPYVLAKLAQAELGAGRTAEGKARLEALDKDGLLPDADAAVALASARLEDLDEKGALDALSTALLQEPKHAAAQQLKARLASGPDPLAQAQAKLVR